MADTNGHPADLLRKAAIGILALDDLTLAFKSASDYWFIDGSIATQNMTLAAWLPGIGSVCLEKWPQMDHTKERESGLFQHDRAQYLLHKHFT